MAKREKKPVHHVQMTEGKRSIIQQLFQEYDIESAQDIQDALKDLLGGTAVLLVINQDAGWQKVPIQRPSPIIEGYLQRFFHTSKTPDSHLNISFF